MGTVSAPSSPVLSSSGLNPSQQRCAKWQWQANSVGKFPPVAVVVVGVVTPKRGEEPKTDGVGEENLSASVHPHLRGQTGNVSVSHQAAVTVKWHSSELCVILPGGLKGERCQGRCNKWSRPLPLAESRHVWAARAALCRGTWQWRRPPGRTTESVRISWHHPTTMWLITSSQAFISVYQRFIETHTNTCRGARAAGSCRLEWRIWFWAPLCVLRNVRIELTEALWCALSKTL